MTEQVLVRLAVSVPDDADRWWDLGTMILGWGLGIVGTSLLGSLTYFARKADKKLDMLGDTLAKHDALFAGQLERNRHQDEWRTRIDDENAKQWDHLKTHDETLSEHREKLAAHGQTLEFLKRRGSDRE